MAQLAISDVSYAQPASLLESQRTQKLGQSAFQRPASNFLGQNPRTILSSETPSLSDIQQLQSSLDRAESQVSQLLISPAKNPALQATINTKVQNLQSRISELKSAIAKAKSDYAAYQKASTTLSEALANLNSATSNKEAALAAYNLAAQQQIEAQATRDAALAARNEAAQQLQNASDELALKQASTNTKLNILNAAALNKALKAQAFSEKATLLQNANVALADAQTQYNTALEAKNSAQAIRDIAQSNYDTNLIPDPDWIAPTYQQEHTRQVENTRTVEVRTLVPHTTTTQQTIPNLLFNSDFSQGNAGWSGLSIGWQNSQPGYFNSNIVFSYTNQTVSQGLYSGPFEDATLTLSADWFNDDSNRNITDSYSMTVEAKDINQNPVGSATYTSEGRHDWETKSITLTPTGPVSYITVSFSGIDNGYWAGNYGPRVKNPTLKVSHGQPTTETTYEEVITYEEEIYYTTETYYTTELVRTEGTLNVKINEGGQATFTAPAGATFTYSNLRYEAIDRPTCGKNITPQLDGLSTITIRALNSVWGDPCGGWYKHITGTLTYEGQPTAPLIHDPALKTILDNAEEVFQTKSDNFSLVEESLTVSKNDQSSANSDYLTANSELTTATTDVDVAQSEYDSASDQLVAASTIKTEVETKKVAADDNFVIADTTAASVAETVTTTTTQLQTAEAASLSATSTFTEAEVAHTEAVTSYQSSVITAKTTSTQLPTENEIQEVSTLIEEEPPVVEEEGSKEIPAELSAENLMEVNLDAVDPTELTEAQAEQLVEAALETFETAEQGSAEYEQALDALYLAAEQDDIELSPELAAIPGLAGAVEALNFIGNAGADMSPKVREESEKVVVAAVVAVGAAVSAATGAATSAAVSAGGSTGSSGSRRIGK